MVKVIIDELVHLKWPAIQQDHRAQLEEIDQGFRIYQARRS